MISSVLVFIIFGSLTTTTECGQVCYHPYLGCFSNEWPFNNSLSTLPKSPDKIGTQFLLYTPTDRDPKNTVFIDWKSSTSLRRSRLNHTLPVKVVIHGFANNNQSEWLYEMKDALLKKAPMNVLVTSWGPGAAAPNYNQAVANTRVVAKQLSRVLKFMHELGVQYKDIHLIGHSLGSHISGYVGSYLREENSTLGRISGMDPAQPEFQDYPIPVRLDKNDAMFVDVIHSNGRDFSEGGFGMAKPCGHVDFFLNGGLDQPDCPANGKQLASMASQLLGIGKRLLFGDMFGDLFDDIACSHSRSHEVFTESINLQNGCLFTAYPCANYELFQGGECLSCGNTGCGIMGYYANEYDARGNFFLNSRMSTPFCGHHFGVKVNLGDNVTTDGGLKLMLNSSWGSSEWMDVTRTTNNDYHFKPAGVLKTVTLSKGVVGNVKTVSLKYTKKGSGGGGQSSLYVDKVIVQSGDSGMMYTVCVQRELQSGVVVSLAVNQSGEC